MTMILTQNVNVAIPHDADDVAWKFKMIQRVWSIVCLSRCLVYSMHVDVESQICEWISNTDIICRTTDKTFAV